jgi:hypothetical protein
VRFAADFFGSGFALGFFKSWGSVVFCWGFCEKGCFERGFLMVRTWWLVVSLWLAGGVFYGGENSDRVLRFIFVSRSGGGGFLH